MLQIALKNNQNGWIIFFRVRQDIRGGAWCPRSVIQVGVEEWLEVNLHTEHWITGAETQGRFGGGQGQEFTEQYQIQYWRESIGEDNIFFT